MSVDSEPMTLPAALRALHAARREQDVVIPTMGAAREWMALGPAHPLDFVLVPSAMGHATSVGLGLALAQPDRRVIVVNGDGSMLMNLGSLITITAENPSNLLVVVCDNGVYEVTGAQPTPAAPAGRTRTDAIDFEALARACGFQSAASFARLDLWINSLPGLLQAPGPAFAVLKVLPSAEHRGPRSPGPAPDRARKFMAAIEKRPLTDRFPV
jgi:sulfopyruvate decarboxylase subunit beta